MKKDKTKEIRSKTAEELKSMVKLSKEKLARSQFELKSGKTANIKEIKNLKKEIAVMLTVLKEHGQN